MHRWLCRSGPVLGVVLALAVLSPGSASAGRESGVSPKMGRSLVVGGIVPCSGLPPRMVQGLPHFAAGTVLVLQGRERWGHLPHGPRRLILPKHVIAKEIVKVNRTYRFALFPGYYVLTARLPHSIERPFTQIVVKEGVTTHANIPNMCK